MGKLGPFITSRVLGLRCRLPCSTSTASKAATVDSSEAIKGVRISEINPLGNKLQRRKIVTKEEHEQQHQSKNSKRIDPEGSRRVDTSFSATLKDTDATDIPYWVEDLERNYLDDY
mmetsp:Transcript_16341/g.39901  ORF Transcript_16341/g.39901 Transcript_16341/m.39901 type:complete len:116 (-) Transcript_16341:22-369(-)